MPTIIIEGQKDRSALLRLLTNDYIEGSGTTHHTQLHKTFTKEKKNTSGKGKKAKES